MLPGQSKWQSSLRVKSVIHITLLSLVGLGFMVGIFTMMERRILIEFEQEKMKITESFVKETLKPVMLSGNAALMFELIENYKKIMGMEEIRIIRSDGKAAFLDNKTIRKINTRLGFDRFDLRPESGPPPQIIPPGEPNMKRVLSERRKIFFVEDPVNGGQISGIMIPILNEESCQICHGEKNRLNGILYTTFSTAERKLKVKNSLVLLSGIAIVGVLFIAAATYIFFDVNVGRPVSGIIKQVNRLVNEEKYDARIELKSRDEMGEIADAFNYFISSVEDYRIKQTREKEKLEKAVEERTGELKEKTLYIENDMKLAKKIQQKLMPEKFPEVENIDFHSTYIPCLAIGGDYYDVLPMPNNYVGVLVADASGHGSSAALLVSIVKTLMSTIAYEVSSPGYVVEVINRTLVAITPDDTFVTLFYGIINVEKGEMTYTLAGHPPPFVYNRHSREIKELKTNGPIVGAFEDEGFQETEFKFESGDRLILFTDGILEAKSKDRKFFGKDMLVSLVRENSELSPKELSEMFTRTLAQHMKDSEIHDDITLLIIDYNDEKKVRNNA